MSDAVLDLLGKIQEKQETIEVSVKAAQAANDEIEKGNLDFKEQLASAAKDIEKMLQEQQDMKSKVTAIEKTAEHLEKMVSRQGGGTGEGVDEMSIKTREEMNRYLRHGDDLSDDVKEHVVRALTDGAFHGLREEQQEAEIKSLVAGSNVDGGFFIRPERQAQMIKRIFETSNVRQYANVITTASDSVEYIIDDDESSSGGWVGEVESRNDTNTPQIGKLTIPVHEQYSQPLATQKMIDDAGFDIEAWLSNKTTSKMSRVENTAFVLGDGSQKPKGFLALPAWAAAGTYERNAIEQIASGAAGGVTSDAFKEMQNSLIEDYQGSAIWTMKRASFLPVITLKDSSGRYIFESRFINNRDEMRLLGKEVVFMNDMPAVANNALSYAYGDFGQGYTVVDRLGFRVIRDVYTNKPYIKFYTTKRVGGAVTNFEALKIMKIDS